MTTLAPKPLLLRADTIDLQSHENPSAKDHTRGQYHLGYNHTGSNQHGLQPGPHHVQALRNAKHESHQEAQRSPRLGGFNHAHHTSDGQTHMYDEEEDEDEDDTHHHGVNGVRHGEAYDDGDGNDSQDEDMDDELMDKISSSPSIEDGPVEEDSARGDPGSRQSTQLSPKRRIDFNDLPSLSPKQFGDMKLSPVKSGITQSSSIENIGRHLLPLDDPFLDNETGLSLDEINFDDLDPDWEDEESFGYAGSSDDDHDDIPFDADSRFVDSGWGGECLRDAEDIDFEFVYALHTFVATVEGQANATKGDTMVLLDDSNSYWWLVRVVKDGSIVNFAPPTYFEPEERVWSDEEDDEDEDGPILQTQDDTVEQTQEHSQDPQQVQEDHQGQQVQQVNDITEPQRVQPASATIHRVNADEDTDEEEPSSPVRAETQALAPLQPGSQEGVQRSRKGVVRNTDSFFRDDTVETKKISLTPGLLRDDSTTAAAQNGQQISSVDTFDKVLGDDKSKDSKKKEKKGMFGGIFKRKDKAGKSKGDTDEADRLSEDSGRSPQSKESMDSDLAPERKPSKLQKSPPASGISKGSPIETRTPQKDSTSTPATVTLRPVQRSQTDPVQAPQPSSLNPEPQSQHPSRFPSLQEKRSVFAPIAGALRSKNSSQDMADTTIKPVYAKRAKERFAIDDSGSDDDSTPTAQSSIHHRSISPLDNNDINQRPDSDVRVSPLDPLTNLQPSVVESNNAEKRSSNQVGNMAFTPTSPSDQTVSTSKQSPSIPTHTPSTSRSTPTWSDASLRSYMDNDQDIRDLLIIVHDKTNVTPVGPDHPLMNGLFASERTKLADMQSQLDSMLITWLSKKSPQAATKV
ncbi:protein phosphatase regulator [Lithohypha guttulata]|uniref:protein phosphatase regulator n=1 Tax=Lithohypha guttulata TaxID=1690604 RepID=UPI002DDFDC50|nr:protein phosphatase regulator [Lithohypha guttulata]